MTRPVLRLQQQATAARPVSAGPPSDAWTRERIVRAAISVANDAGQPPLLLLALAVAESDLDPRAERWAGRTGEAKAAIAAGDLVGLRRVLELVERERPGDVSFGLCQPTWKWRDPDEFPGAAADDLYAILAYRERYFDPVYALRRGARRLAPYWRRYRPDVLATLSRYNKPALDLADNPNLAVYRRGIARATAILKASREGLG